MDVHPTAYHVQQMSQQLPYSHPYPYPTPASKPPPPLQIQPQQPLDHTQFFPGTFPPNDKQQQLYHPQQQQPQQQQHQLFPTQQAYPQLQQPSQSFYGNPENPQFSRNGVMQTAAQNVRPQIYAASSNNQTVNTTGLSAPSVAPSEASPSVTASQQPQSMTAPTALLTSSNPFTPRSSPPNGGLAQQYSQLQSRSQVQAPNQAQSNAQQPQSSQSVAREKARVSVLLEINSYLLQEVVSLQAQGKAGAPPTSLPQQSPTQETAAGSPASATDPSNPLNNSPIDPSKPLGAKPPSQEYIECMRRLQANLAYLAAIADAKKKAAGSIPATPAIMVPPSHLPDVRELYKKLNGLFLGSDQPSTNKTMPVSGLQSQKPG